MTVTFRDEIGVVSMHNIVDIQFDGAKAYFTDEWGVDITVKVEHLISIVTTETQANLCGYAE